MGVKPWRENVEPTIMFDRAKTACSMARGDYQNPLVVYDEDMRLKEMFNQRLINDLKKAIAEKQFLVYYQPKYDISYDPPKLSSCEALIRWKHPELGMVSPGEFVPLFESNGMISEVDSYVWQEAAEQIGRWKKELNFSLPVSVNISRTDVFNTTLGDKFIELIRKNSLNYDDLKLEITESAYTDNGKQLLDLINRLRGVGFQIEMDDFGSGYSSLNMLSSLPIDILKMDMKFVKKIEESETDYRLVRLIIDIARYLNLKVVAEGVETAGQLRLLKEAGCDLIQGFYFSKPVPADEIRELILKEQSIKRS